MTEAVEVAPASVVATSALAARPAMMRKPNCMIHIGRPDVEEPHRSMERCEKFRAEEPNVRFIVVVWDDADAEAMREKLKPIGGEVILWKDDMPLMLVLMDFLGVMVGAQIVSPRWYLCPQKHITFGTYKLLVEKCETCGEATVCVEPYKDRVQQFCEVFLKVVKLANFDTTSGQFLHAAVSPTKNVLKNMRYIDGCDHAALESHTGRLTGKTAILCGAGPSLEDAIPDLVRLSARDDIAVFCVGRAFKMLRAAGVSVDYTVSCEMFDWDAAIFDGVTRDMACDTVLAFASVCSPATVKAWPGRKAVMLDVETATMLDRKDWIFGGNSVAHHMMNFALQVCDAKEAVLVGIDLAYTKPQTHADGTHHDKWPDRIKEGELNYQDELWVRSTGKGMDFHPECHRMPAASPVGIGAFVLSRTVEVRSSPAYENFATLFSMLIQKHGRKVWNACPNGQKIDGTEYLDLKEWLV